ncbi:TonB-dependent receptor [Pseudoalteromonas sp. SSDWG2]|uniref:TonB-dependent receptor n=1 Tax=Pseudoalteromonas sp. SSDWG2 TaxID=3139391 RepID=UPI003BAA7B33
MKAQAISTQKLLLASLVYAALHQGQASAEETQRAPEERTLETITVTSLKRTQSLNEVPISVSAVNAEKLENSGIERLEDLSGYIPNFKIARDSIADRINIRGMQSGNLAGFEQSVGTFVNGVYRGRGVQSRFSFLDVERVEVMRGPQSILFGKNTVAGALNITTARPDEEFNGRVSASYNPTHDQTELSGMITGALSDDVRARAFVLSREMEEGWLHNNFYDQGGPLSDELMGRFTLEWDAGDNTLVTVMLESSEFEFDAFPHGTRQAGPIAAFGAIESYTEANIGNTHPVLNFGSSQRMDGDSDEFSITSETQFDQGTLTVTGGYSAYQFERSLDADYSALDGIRFNDSEDFSQTSLEVRFASNTGGDFEYMTGLYWQTQDLKVDGLSLFNIPTLQQVLLGGCTAGVNAFGGDINSVYVPGDVVSTGVGVIGLGGPASLLNACGTAAAFAGIPDGVGRYAQLNQDADTYGIFAQGTWNMTEDFRATVGLRYTKEDKSADKVSYATDFTPNNKTQSTTPWVIAVAEQVGEFKTHSFTSSDPGMSRSENSLDWSVNLQYDVNDDTMSYANASTGFKSGGFNSFYMRSPQGADSNDVAFEEEDVIAFEIGAKTTLFDGVADVNIAAFHSTFDDIQVAVFSGNTTFEVKNAAKATSYGLEVDGRWAATESLTVTGALGLLNFEYDDFANQACTSNQFLSTREALYAGTNDIGQKIGIAMGYNNAACAASGVNDLSGKTASNAPDMTASLVFNHIADFDNYELVSNLDLNYRSSVYRVDDLDPIGKEPSETFVNASIRLNSLENGWSLTLIGKNLTDVEHFDYINDVPLFAGAHNFMPLAGRNFTLRFDYAFGE